MPPGGALDKLFLQFLTGCRSLSTQFSHLMPRKRKVPGAARAGPNGSTPATPAVVPQQSLTKSSSIPETQGGVAVDSQQGGMQGPWRPYKGRWDAKVAYRDNRAEAPLHKNANGGQSLRRGRQWQQTQGSGQQSNGQTQLYSGQPGRSLSPRRDLPPQSYQPQNNDPNAFSMGNVLADYSFWNPFAMFGGISMPMDPSLFAQQQSLFTPNISEQLMQSQFLQQQPLDQPLPNLPFTPLPGGSGPYMPMRPFLPPSAAPMNFGPDHTPVPSPAGLVANPPVHPIQSQTGPVHTSKRPVPRLPSATENYLHQSSLPPTSTSTPQPLLVILDLNGTLIFRKTRKFPPSFSRRVGLDDFLSTLIEKYKVMIWSSSQPPTVDAVCRKLFSEPKRKELVAEWGRDKLGLSKSEYNSKIQVYKTLETVWSSKDVQASYPSNEASESNDTTSAGARWDQTNTILIDDSKLKAVSEPYNLIEIPEFTNAPGVDESYIFPKVLQLLEILARCDDVSKMLHVWDSRASNTGIINLDIKSLHLEPGASLDPQHDVKVDPAQARLDKRKSRKREKKAAKQAAAIFAAKAAVMAQGTSQTQDHQSTLATHAESIEFQEPSLPLNPNHSEAKERSVSPVSVQSENFLLDRLEESLNSR
ncbi:NLI interacting factor-like phosphatase-domain-containing protein [Aspergillus pseudodeflectus]|uniref:NLI interacting factor-like phosphatase-domain-containing protein n=1 Tax=Aspergillus pseudodeflectus TaxID=176178 RepID=A0ABR4JX62_9EURO